MKVSEGPGRSGDNTDQDGAASITDITSEEAVTVSEAPETKAVVEDTSAYYQGNVCKLCFVSKSNMKICHLCAPRMILLLHVIATSFTYANLCCIQSFLKLLVLYPQLADFAKDHHKIASVKNRWWPGGLQGLYNWMFSPSILDFIYNCTELPRKSEKRRLLWHRMTNFGNVDCRYYCTA